jgi:hypothetical protein
MKLFGLWDKGIIRGEIRINKATAYWHMISLLASVPTVIRSRYNKMILKEGVGLESMMELLERHRLPRLRTRTVFIKKPL